MNKIISATFFVIVFFTACKTNNNSETLSAKLDQKFLDSVISQSDTSFTKPYPRPDFVSASYYISRKDSFEMQVMRDSATHVRQVVILKHGRRSYFAQYFANGQLIAKLALDPFGQYNGPATYYYENGKIMSEGNYKNGLSSGEWKELDKNGHISIVKYDGNGTRVN